MMSMPSRSTTRSRLTSWGRARATTSSARPRPCSSFGSPASRLRGVGRVRMCSREATARRGARASQGATRTTGRAANHQGAPHSSIGGLRAPLGLGGAEDRVEVPVQPLEEGRTAPSRANFRRSVASSSRRARARSSSTRRPWCST